MRRFKRPPEIPGRPIYLREWRRHCKVTLEQITALCGFSKGSLSKIEINELFYPPDPVRQDIDRQVAAMTPAQRAKAAEMLRILTRPNDDDLALQSADRMLLSTM